MRCLMEEYWIGGPVEANRFPLRVAATRPDAGCRWTRKFDMKSASVSHFRRKLHTHTHTYLSTQNPRPNAGRWMNCLRPVYKLARRLIGTRLKNFGWFHCWATWYGFRGPSLTKPESSFMKYSSRSTVVPELKTRNRIPEMINIIETIPSCHRVIQDFSWFHFKILSDSCSDLFVYFHFFTIVVVKGVMTLNRT